MMHKQLSAEKLLIYVISIGGILRESHYVGHHLVPRHAAKLPQYN